MMRTLLRGPANDPDEMSPSIAHLPEDDFWKSFERRYGANPDLSHPSIRAYILPLLRADFQLVETYRCATDVCAPSCTAGDAVCADPLEVPIAAIGAKGDNR